MFMLSDLFRRRPKRLASPNVGLEQAVETPEERSVPSHPWDLPWQEAATPLDILACFRLILGRRPNLEEWPGHSSRAGEPLTEVVRTFVNSSEFHDRKLQETHHPEGITSADTGRFLIHADRNDSGLGAPALDGTYEIGVSATISGRLSPGDVMVDIGANLGYLSMLAASCVGPQGTVYAVEPNPFNVALLELSRRDNGFDQVRVLQVAAAERVETLFLHAATGNGSTAPLDPTAVFAQRTVPGLPMDLILSDRPGPVRLVKIDVEGFEWIALRGMIKTLMADCPDIIFEFAPASIRGGGAAFLHWLVEIGYDFSVIGLDGPGKKIVAEDVLAAHEAAGVDHIDVLATPKAAVPLSR